MLAIKLATAVTKFRNKERNVSNKVSDCSN